MCGLAGDIRDPIDIIECQLSPTLQLSTNSRCNWCCGRESGDIPLAATCPSQFQISLTVRT